MMIVQTPSFMHPRPINCTFGETIILRYLQTTSTERWNAFHSSEAFCPLNRSQPPEPSLAPRADAVSIFKNSTASAISIPDYILKQSNSVSYAIVTFAYDKPGIPPLQILADGCSAFLDKHLMKQFCR